MIPEQRLVTLINASTSITASLYPQVRPASNTLPSIVYELTSNVIVNNSTGCTTTANARITLDIIASSYSGMKTLGTQVASAIRASTSEVWHLDDESDDTPEIDLGTDMPTEFHLTQDWTVWYSSTE